MQQGHISQDGNRVTYHMPHLKPESVRSYEDRHFEVPRDITHVRLFHGTSTAFFRRIIEHGLQNSNTSGSMIDDGDWMSEPHLAYLGHPYRCFYEYASRTAQKVGGTKMLVEVAAPVNKLTEDFEEIRGTFTNWRDCLEHFLICAQPGNIPKEDTVALHIFNPWGFATIDSMVDGSKGAYRRIPREEFGEVDLRTIIYFFRDGVIRVVEEKEGPSSQDQLDRFEQQVEGMLKQFSHYSTTFGGSELVS